MKWLLVIGIIAFALLLLLWRIAFASAVRLPKVSEAAPDFSLPDQDGRMHGLGEFRGRSLVLYFFPRADTPG